MVEGRQSSTGWLGGLAEASVLRGNIESMSASQGVIDKKHAAYWKEGFRAYCNEFVFGINEAGNEELFYTKEGSVPYTSDQLDRIHIK